MKRKVPGKQHNTPTLNEENVTRFIFLMRDKHIKDAALQLAPDDMPCQQLLQYLLKLFNTITAEHIHSPEFHRLIWNLTTFFNTSLILVTWIQEVIRANE